MGSTEPLAELPSELDVGDALALAVRLHRKGHLEDAQTIYQRILAVEPEHTGALVFLGAVSMHRGRVDEAVGLMRKAIALEPARADCLDADRDVLQILLALGCGNDDLGFVGDLAVLRDLHPGRRRCHVGGIGILSRRLRGSFRWRSILRERRRRKRCGSE